MDTGPLTEPGWTAVGVFRPLLHRADLSTPPWRHRGMQLWFAACNCPVQPLRGGCSTAGRWYCTECRKLGQ